MALRAGVELVSTSEMTTFRRCQKEYFFSYILRRSSKIVGKALKYGKEIHGAIGAHHRGEQVSCEGFSPAQRALTAGYRAYWGTPDMLVRLTKTDVKFQVTIAPGISIFGEFDGVGEMVDSGKRVIAEHKCIPGDAIIFDPKRGTYARVDELYRSRRSATVTSMLKDGSFAAAVAKPVELAGVRPIVSIRTVTGRVLRASENHPVWTFGDGWLPAGAVSIGDWVAVPKRLKCGRADNRLNDEATRLIGYMIGDGCISNMTFTKNDRNVLDDVVRCAASVGEEVSIRSPRERAKYIKMSVAAGRYYGYVGPASQLMRGARLDGNAASKRIPFHLRFSDRQLGQLLGALWSTDGCIDTFGGKKPRIIYTSVSLGLCVDIQHALQRLGIVSSVRSTSVSYLGKRRPTHTVQVVSRESKRVFLKLAVDGTIPVLRSAVPISAVLAAIPCSRQGSDRCRQPELNETIWWDRVESSSLGSEELTYDLTVPGVHNFVVNGIVTHNTSSEDISPGSPYWMRVAHVDPQVTTYLIASKVQGWGHTEVLYDVMRKPLLRQGAKESEQDFEIRILEDISERPTFYFQRQPIVRLEHEHAEYIRDIKGTVHLMRAARELGANVPRNPDACFKWGRPCDFFPVCSGETSIDDDTRYMDRRSKGREELEEKNGVAQQAQQQLVQTGPFQF